MKTSYKDLLFSYFKKSADYALKSKTCFDDDNWIIFVYNPRIYEKDFENEFVKDFDYINRTCIKGPNPINIKFTEVNYEFFYGVSYLNGNLVTTEDVEMKKSTKIFFKNKLLERIFEEFDKSSNWNSIEYLYFHLLNKFANKFEDNTYEVEKLNKELSQIKLLLKDYLKSLNYLIDMRFYHLFDKKIFSNRIERTLLLNFNYTPTILRYLEEFSDHNYEHLQIHGGLDNEICFGYGDEFGDDYQKIENINKNEYLENVKSFYYLQNDNYKILMNFLNQNFEVVVLGHSCGISDRTLLKEIFQHVNFEKIKVFYSIFKTSDNYNELSYNISRNFDNKTILRRNF